MGKRLHFFPLSSALYHICNTYWLGKEAFPRLAAHWSQYCYGSLPPHLMGACENGCLEFVQQQLRVCWLLLRLSCLEDFPHFSVLGLCFVFLGSSHATGDPCKPQWFHPAYLVSVAVSGKGEEEDGDEGAIHKLEVAHVMGQLFSA